MSGSLPSDEVAEDYRNALDDLVTNDRYQIANLTMIAKENIEHAEAISRVLINHINRTSPSRKLPALYVLDSLVKNIGSPYTVYFGRNLHSTFMLAYSQVDAAIRRKLEEMLRTWREPIPGSLSTTPVFPLQSTQSIVDTLNRYRASTTPLNQRNQPAPVQHTRIPSVQPYRNTPTPPQTTIANHVPPIEAHTRSPAPQYSLPGHVQGGPGFPVAVVPPPSGQMKANNHVDLAKLHADIDNLTTDAKIECATHPMDLNAQRKLTTLQTLKELLDAGSASDQDLYDIQNTIKHELEKKAITQAPPVQIQPLPPQPIYPPNHGVQAQISSTPIPPLPFLNQANLAELLRATGTARETPHPPLQFSNTYQQPSVPSLSTPPPVPNPVYSQPAPAAQGIPAGALSFLDQLRASGLLSSTPALPQGSGPTSGLSPFLTQGNAEIQRTSASLRIPRPHIVKSFLEERPNQCSTCGKRFTSDNVGKERKARHLDWHFKTKARMLEAEKRGQNRSWYTDAREWIASKDFDDEVIDAEATTGASSSTTHNQKAQDFVRAPTDPVLRNAPCPIDQEPFKSEWSEEVQDFIWKDAIRVGNRYYHASCYREATKDRDRDGAVISNTNGSARTATPDSVLGKRKAETSIEANTAARLKVET